LLGEITAPGDLVLIKGSRAARTEEVIEQFDLRHSLATPEPGEGGSLIIRHSP